MNLRALLIRRQRLIFIHGIQLGLRRLVDFLHLRFLIVGQVQSGHRTMLVFLMLRWRGLTLVLILRRGLRTLRAADSRRKGQRQKSGGHCNLLLNAAPAHESSSSGLAFFSPTSMKPRRRQNVALVSPKHAARLTVPLASRPASDSAPNSPPK